MDVQWFAYQINLEESNDVERATEFLQAYRASEVKVGGTRGKLMTNQKEASRLLRQLRRGFMESIGNIENGKNDKETSGLRGVEEMKPHGAMTLDKISGELGERAAFAQQDNESTPSSIAMPSNQLEESAYMQTFKQFAARDKQEQAEAQAREKIYQDCLRLQKQKYDERKARVKDMVKLAGRDLHRYPELLTLAIKYNVWE